MSDLLGLGATEVVVVQSLGGRDAGNVDLGLGGNDVDLVDPPEGASVDAERSGDEEQTGSQLLQEHDALSLMDAGDQDQHGAGGDGGAKLAVVLAERLLVELNDALVALLLTADLLRHRRRLLDDGR